jgi:hypothetical protein
MLIGAASRRVFAEIIVVWQNLRIRSAAEPGAAPDGGRDSGFLEFPVLQRGRRCELFPLGLHPGV